MARIHHLNIGTRLGFGFAAVLCLQLLVAGIGMSQMATLSDRLTEFTEVSEAKLKALGDVERAVAARAIAARNLALVDLPIQQKADLERVKTAQAHLDDGFKDLGRLMSAPGTDRRERAMFEQLKELEAKYLPIANDVVNLATTLRSSEAVQRLSKDCMPQLTLVTEHLATFGSLLRQQASDGAAAAHADYVRAKWVMVLVALGSLVGGFVVAWRLTRSITRPIGEAVAMAERVATGDLTSRIDVHGSDEAAKLLAALRRMNDSLVEVVGRVRRTSDSMATGSSQIAAGNADLSRRTEEQASSLQQTASSMEELASTVKSNAESAGQASQLAVDASAVAARGGEVVGQVVTTMQEISASSRKIADIIGVIDGIAFQTNILALNAAVEAARAGEQGRGFAVVAGEVRSLAQRSAQAAKEIKALIGASVERVEAGSRLVNDAGATMHDIVDHVRKVSDLIGEISSATGEQSSGIDQVNGAVSQLDRVTQQNAALVEQSAAAAQSLRQQAGQLVEAVAVFRVNEEQGMRVPAASHVPSVKQPVPAPAKVPTLKDMPGSGAGVRIDKPASTAKSQPVPAVAAAAETEDWTSF